jgi:hypothetical protein
LYHNGKRALATPVLNFRFVGALARLERSVPEVSVGSQSVLELLPQWASKSELNSAPWNTAPYEGVSLFDMLQYAAAAFYKLSEEFSTFALTPMVLTKPEVQQQLQLSLNELHEYCEKLNLPLSQNQIETVVDAVHGNDVEAVRRSFAELQKRVYQELKAKVVFCLPGEKVRYWSSFWLIDTKIYDHFPSAWHEFQRAGHCYAFGENTACVFHVMRIVDFGLRQVAKSLGIEYDARNWSGIGNKIQEKMEQKYNTKTDEWKKSEPMYAEILTDILAIGRGHRNPVLHELEKKYEERDAQHMLNVVEGFMLHLAKHGFREVRGQAL